MSLNTEVGAKVIYTGHNGHGADHELAVSSGLVLGHEYEVISMRVGGHSSKVQIQQGYFNSVIFENSGPVPDVMPDDGRLDFSSIPGVACHARKMMDLDSRMSDEDFQKFAAHDQLEDPSL